MSVFAWTIVVICATAFMTIWVMRYLDNKAWDRIYPKDKGE